MWDESEHNRVPKGRPEGGRFVKNGESGTAETHEDKQKRFDKDQAEREKLAKKYVGDEDKSYAIIAADGAKVPKEALTKDEWAWYYKKLGEIKTGGYVDKTKSGDYVFSIGNKTIVSTDNYENPICKAVIIFSGDQNDGDIVNTIEELRYKL